MDFLIKSFKGGVNYVKGSPPPVVPSEAAGTTLEKAAVGFGSIGVGTQVYDSWSKAHPSEPDLFETKERIFAENVAMATEHANSSCAGLKCLSESCKISQTMLAEVTKQHCKFLLTTGK